VKLELNSITVKLQNHIKWGIAILLIILIIKN